MSVKDDVEGFDSVFDFTIRLEEDEQKIIREFVQIKELAEKKILMQTLQYVEEQL